VTDKKFFSRPVKKNWGGDSYRRKFLAALIGTYHDHSFASFIYLSV
jgi:hypothetical protein